MLLFSEYDRTLKNISISQPMVDVDIEDTNSLIIRYPKFKRVTHLILSYDAQNLFLKQNHLHYDCQNYKFDQQYRND